MSAVSARRARLAAAAASAVTGEEMAEAGPSTGLINGCGTVSSPTPSPSLLSGPRNRVHEASDGKRRRGVARDEEVAAEGEKKQRLTTAAAASNFMAETHPQSGAQKESPDLVNSGNGNGSSSSSSSSSSESSDNSDGESTGDLSGQAVSRLRDDGAPRALLACCSPFPAWNKGKQRDGQRTDVVCGIKRGQTLCLVGVASITVLAGMVTLGGAKLNPAHVPSVLFAPKSSPLPIIQASDAPALLSAELKRLVPEGEFGAVIRVDELSTTGIEHFAKACHLMRPDAFQLLPPTPQWPLRCVQPVTDSIKGLVAIQGLPSWTAALDCVTARCATYMLRGMKRTGKSTFSRHLVQRLQSLCESDVCFLELDLGQSEFGVPASVALHVLESCKSSARHSASLVIGPSWACLRQPVRSHFLGDVSPRDDPRSYMSAVHDLLGTYRRCYEPLGVPLVANTQGWIKGLGADLLLQLEQVLLPDHIFDMRSEEDLSYGVQPGERIINGVLDKVVPLEAAPASLTRERGPNAIEARTLVLVSYFYATYLPVPAHLKTDGDHSAHPSWNFVEPLVEQTSMVVDVEVGLLGGIHILPFGAAVEEHLVLSALNGSCVAIVLLDANGQPPADAAPHMSAERTVEGKWFAALRRKRPSPSRSTQLGLAIVRSIDVQSGKLHLLAPIAPESLTAAVSTFAIHDGAAGGAATRPSLALVKGALEVPVWLSMDRSLLLANAPRGASVPNAALSGELDGGHADATSPMRLAGVPLHSVPYLDFADEPSSSTSPSSAAGAAAAAIGLNKRRIRRNLLRPSQHRQG